MLAAVSVGFVGIVCGAGRTDLLHLSLNDFQRLDGVSGDDNDN